MSTSTEIRDPRPIVVMKYGGTSVSSASHWGRIRDRVRERLAAGERPLLVASALEGVSNQLERLIAEAPLGQHTEILATLRAQHEALATALGLDGEPLIAETLESLGRLACGASLTGEVSPGLRARFMAHGELLSTRLGAAYLEAALGAEGQRVSWADVRDWLEADAPSGNTERRSYLTAHVSHAPDPDLRERLDHAPVDVWVTQGFIARGHGGNTVLLGRGGSDTSATVLAAKLSAARAEIWTDVPGIYTANPHLIPSARLLKALSYEEASEITSCGAKVLHPRCIRPAWDAQVPLHVRSTEHPELSGTCISDDAPESATEVKAIGIKQGVVLVSMDAEAMWHEAGFLARAFAVFERHRLSIDLVSTSETSVTVSLDARANVLDLDLLDALLGDLAEFCRARLVEPCAAVSLVGRHIGSLMHKLGSSLDVFSEQRLHLVSQAANDLNLTFVVDESKAEKVARKIHGELFAGAKPSAVFGPSWEELFDEASADDDRPREVFHPEPPWWRVRRDELVALAAEASPLFVYDQDSLDAAAERLLAMDNVDRVLYAIKANWHPEVIRRFDAAGLGFECVSPGELAHLTATLPDLDPGRVLFTPNFAPRKEYADALAMGVQVTLDNLHPLRAWPELFKDQPVFLRLDPGQGRGHHKYVHTAGNVSKFGISVDQCDELDALLDKSGARVVGLHAHAGSGILTPGNWSETAGFLGAMKERYPEVRVLDLGGGLGVVEKPGQQPLDLATVNENLARVRAAFPDVELWLEPGRYLVANAGVLLANVTQTKEKGSFSYVGIDAGMNTLMRPALYGAWHEIVNLSRLDERADRAVNVVGPICESGDTLGYDRHLPNPQEGDVLLIATAGAYGRAMSSSYNLRPPAAEHILRPV